MDWTGDQLPNEMQLHQMKPLICNFYFWNERLVHSFVSANVPSQYVLAGNIPPLYTEETNTYGGGWPIGESLYLQREWEGIDAIRRAQFKQAADDDKEVMVGRSCNVAAVRVHLRFQPYICGRCSRTRKATLPDTY
ncbi:hypothetical protein Q0F98_00725 [Paenibacillus amylolyticus]|nr:hypothetical protein Q0F98_00725 [Paenibacillus amylolyticus]